MKKAIGILLVFLLAIPAVQAADSRAHRYSKSGCNDSHLNNVSIDIDDGTLILTHHDRHKGTVEITEDYELYVNGRHVKTNGEQRELLGEYYELMTELVARATALGLAGAEIGVEGGELALSAVGGVLKVLFTDYDSDDLERDIEKDAKRLEARAKKLERKGKKIEAMAYELEEISDDLNREIAALRKLDWF